MTTQHYDVFISRKSQDAPLAKELYDFLTSKGLRVFDSEHSLPELGNADYQKAIDQALDSCTHLIVLGSSVEHITSPWVEAEWRLFINEKRSGYKTGNILSVVAKTLNLRSLPASLRYYEAIVLEKTNFERILAYVKPLDENLSNNIDTPVGAVLKPSKEEVEDWFNKGWEADSNKEYVEAVKWYRKAAEQGNADALRNLGLSYEFGYGVEKDEVEAVKWYRKAVEQGNDYAQFNLGCMYERGRGVEKNEVEAVKWYRKAAESGYASVQFELGWMYEKGRGVEKNEVEAVKWYRKRLNKVMPMHNIV
jgi:TPR repeat protein